MEKKKLTKSNIYMLTGIVVLVLAVAGSAYAYYSASATGEIVGTAAGAGLELTISKLSTGATGDLIPLDNTPDMLTKAAKGYGNNGSTFDKNKSCIDKNGYTVCQVYKITISNTGTVPVTVNGGVTLYGTNTPNIECSKMANSTSVTDNVSCKGDNTLANNLVLNSGSSMDYYIIVYINNLNENQEDKDEFYGEVTFTSTTGAKLKAKFTEDVLLTDYINNLYSTASKTTVTNNSIEYNYATSVNLMNDRLGGTTSNYDGGNIRYYGANPNNYIDIGDTDSSGNVILYRIIGLFKDITLEDGTKQDLIKVVRNDTIGAYSWDSSASTVNNGWGINEWSQADAMKLLNPGYENNQDINNAGSIISVNNSLWYNSKSGTCYNKQNNATTTCDFTSTGLSNNVKNKIKMVVWNTCGYNDSSIYSNQIYQYERGNDVIQNPSDGVTRNTTWIGKVGLMYPSDYGYGADFNSCTKPINNYDSCIGNNWLYKNNTNQWLLMSRTSNTISPWVIYASGFVGNGNDAAFQFSPRPAFYLSSDVVIESEGDGTSSYPYIVG